MVVTTLILAACGNDRSESSPDDRQFANDPTKPATATVPAPPTTPAEPTVPPTRQASPEALLDSRGGASFTYVLIGTRIIRIEPSSGAPKPLTIEPPQGQRFVALDSSTSGSRVIGLTVDSNGSFALVMYDSEGALQNQWAVDLAAGPVSATPRSAVSSSADDAFVDWGIDGSHILTGTGRSLKSVDLEGQITDIPLARNAGTLVRASWSPANNTIALLLDRDGARIVALTAADQADARPRQILPADSSAESVGDFAWTPNGSGIVYTQTSNSGKELRRFDIDGGRGSVIATAGQGGPSATIERFSTSPDGRAVAYVIDIEEGDQRTFHSLWVRSIDSSQAYLVPTGTPTDLNALWWTRGGLQWGQLDRDEQGRTIETFNQIQPGGQPARVTSIDLNGMDAGTLPASPVASPSS